MDTKHPFEKVVADHGATMLRVCRVLLAGPDADDAWSETFLAALRAYGQTRSYGQVAELVGNPKAVRAVGTACATNPLPVVVPCHRVLKAGGAPGGYVGGPEAKLILLTLEAAA